MEIITRDQLNLAWLNDRKFYLVLIKFTVGVELNIIFNRLHD
jgi:hypothetical protein